MKAENAQNKEEDIDIDTESEKQTTCNNRFCSRKCWDFFDGTDTNTISPIFFAASDGKL